MNKLEATALRNELDSAFSFLDSDQRRETMENRLGELEKFFPMNFSNQLAQISEDCQKLSSHLH